MARRSGRRTPTAASAAAGSEGRAGAYVRWAVLVAVLVGVVVMTPTLMGWLVPRSVTWAWIAATARVSAWTMSVAGIPCRLAEGNLLHLTNHTFRIDAACTGGEWLVMYAAAVLLMPVRLERKWHGLLGGLPLLAAFNLLRLLLVAAASTWWPARFVFLHDVVMQVAFVLLTAAVWVAWMWRVRNDWLPGWEV